VQPSDRLYDDYVAFKGWEADDSVPDTPDLEAVIRHSGRTEGALLDVGFGRGELLDWARSAGFSTAGVEVVPELVDRARSRGHEAVDNISRLPPNAFDVITAIDVLEHLSREQLREFFVDVRRVIRPDGVLVARFPNGQSPFSGAYQNGDLTHLLALTPSAARQAALGSGMDFVSSHNFRPVPPGLRGAKRRLAYVLRDLIESVLGVLYVGHRVPMDPNIVVVFRAAPR
jgi:SAM-dependent methyltransferase